LKVLEHPQADRAPRILQGRTDRKWIRHSPENSEAGMKQMIGVLVLLVTLAFFSPSISAANIKVSGYVESESGFVFPDGTIQTSAVSNGYENVINVAKSGADFINIQSAINSVTAASPSNKTLIRVAPGSYSGSVVMKSYVDVEGSGPGLTRITSDATAAAVKMADKSRLSSLQIFCLRSSGCIGIQAQGNILSAHVHDVDVTVSASLAAAEGTAIAVSANSPDSARLWLSDVSTYVSAPTLGTGVLVSGKGEISMRDSVVRVAGPYDYLGEARGIEVDGNDARAFVRDSRIEISGFADDAIGVRVEDGRVDLWQTQVWASSAQDGATAMGCEIRGSALFEAEYATFETTGTNEWGVLSQNNSSGNGGMKIRVLHSRIQAKDYTVFNPIASSDAVYLFTHFDGGAALGQNTCSYSTDESYTTYDSGCP
jgi:hypothetical protein